MSTVDTIAVIYGSLLFTGMSAAVLWTLWRSRCQRLRDAEEDARPWEPAIYTVYHNVCGVCRMPVKDGEIVWHRRGRFIHEACLDVKDSVA